MGKVAKVTQKVPESEMVGMFTVAIVWNNGDPVGKSLQIHMSVHGQWPDGLTGQKLLADALEKASASVQKRLNESIVKERVASELKAPERVLN